MWEPADERGRGGAAARGQRLMAGNGTPYRRGGVEAPGCRIHGQGVVAGIIQLPALAGIEPAARIVTGGVLVSTGVSKQRGACRGACPR